MENILKKIVSLNEKSIMILLRFLVIIVTYYLSLYNIQKEYNAFLLWAIFGFFIFSNLAFILFDRQLFTLRRFRIIVFFIDVILISSIIYFTRGFDTDLYLAYFLIIFMSGGSKNISFAFITTLVAASIYTLLLTVRGVKFSIDNPALFIRIPFFFVISFIFLYYAREERDYIEKQVTRMDRLSMLGEMLAAVLHELKNPLTIILGYASEMDKAKTPEKQKEVWADITEAVRKSSKIVKNILSYVRYSDRAEQTVMNLNELVDSTIEIAYEQLKINKIQLVKEYDPSIPVMVGNNGYLQQVFLNIINNARIAMVKHEGIKKLTVTTTMWGKNVIIKFADTGPGIKQDNIEKIFEPFFTTRSEGTGLGLSLCYKIVKQHGGDISVSSKPGKGAVFTILLPVSNKQELNK